MSSSSPPFRLKITDELFVLEAVGGALKGSTLEINRSTAKITDLGSVRKNYDPKADVIDAFGIVGVVNLLAGPYLIVATKCKTVASITGSQIYQMTHSTIVPFNPSTQLSEKKKRDEERYLQLLNAMTAAEAFYFSYTYDVTHSLQRIFSLSEEERSQHLWQRADSRFFWNRQLLSEFVGQRLTGWVVPLMLGFLQSHECTIGGKPATLTVISRRNTKRAGTRYHVRGIDSQGNVANNVETEQLVEIDLLDGRQRVLLSYIQTRGSIPVYWRQPPTLKYTPRMALHKSEQESAVAFRRHMESQQGMYGRNVLVNLVKQTGQESTLADAYQRQVSQWPSEQPQQQQQLRYVGYDFHRATKKKGFNKGLEPLVAEVEGEFDLMGWFQAVVDVSTTTSGGGGPLQGTVVRQQKGVFRTNCIDCLDRTNVVQSLFAHAVLERQLRALHLLGEGEPLATANPSTERLFKYTWGDNADALSRQYSGTGALKADFTKTGKRTLSGILNDGTNSLTRYYLNNFKDGRRQDAFDLFLGHHTPNASAVESPFSKRERRDKWLVVVAIAALVVVVMLLTSILSAGGVSPLAITQLDLAAILVTMAWLMLLVGGWRAVTKYGHVFVDSPSFMKE